MRSSSLTAASNTASSATRWFRGRPAGSRVFLDWCKRNGVACANNQVDIGVRVELPAMVWEHFSKKIYEPKILYRSKAYGDTTRMFCFNERGLVVTENTDGVLTVNGHAYKELDRKTDNSNFALLCISGLPNRLTIRSITPATSRRWRIRFPAAACSSSA